MNEQDISIVLNLIIIVIGLYLIFFKSYFSEKGKNLATTEDIGAITKIVESIKQDYSSQIEKIKVELSLVSKTYEVIYDDERKAIIEFMGTITEFYESNIDIPIKSASSESVAYLYKRIEDLNIDYSKVLISKSKLLLFCFDNEVLEATNPVLGSLVIIQGKTQNYRYNILACQKQFLKFEQLNPKLSVTEISLKFEEMDDGQTQIYKEFLKYKISSLKEYVVLYNNLLNICKVYLQTKKAI